jgi:hypothetical protein
VKETDNKEDERSEKEIDKLRPEDNISEGGDERHGQDDKGMQPRMGSPASGRIKSKISQGWWDGGMSHRGQSKPPWNREMGQHVHGT